MRFYLFILTSGGLPDLCTQVAIGLNKPKEIISVELIFRSLGHFYQYKADTSEAKGNDLVSYLVEHYQVLGLVKCRRKRHREQEAKSKNIWLLTS